MSHVSDLHQNITNGKKHHLTRLIRITLKVYQMTVKNVVIVRRKEDDAILLEPMLRLAGWASLLKTAHGDPISNFNLKTCDIWFSLNKAKQLANEFGVRELLDPIFNYVPLQNPNCDLKVSLWQIEAFTAIYRDNDTEKLMYLLTSQYGSTPGIVLDRHGNTAIHLSVKHARLEMTRQIVKVCGSVVMGVNYYHESVLMTACESDACYNHQLFPAILDMIKPCIYMIDGEGNTILHHFANQINVTERENAIKYYLDHVLGVINRSNSAASLALLHFRKTRRNGNVSPEHVATLERNRHFIDVQDSKGDTALHLFCRAGNVFCVQNLLRLGADTSLRNIHGKSVYDLCTNSPALYRIVLLHKLDKKLTVSIEEYTEIQAILNFDNAHLSNKRTTGLVRQKRKDYEDKCGKVSNKVRRNTPECTSISQSTTVATSPQL